MLYSESQCSLPRVPLHVLMVAFDEAESASSFRSVFTSLNPNSTVEWIPSVQKMNVGDQCDVIVVDCRKNEAEWENIWQVLDTGKHPMVLGVMKVSQNNSSQNMFTEDAIGYQVDEGMALQVLKWMFHHAQEHKQCLSERDLLRNDLMQATNKAEIADVVSTVLHNVGNVLTSVMVAANVVESVVQQSSVSLVSRMAELLRTHQEDLGTYLTEDQKGKRIPPSLEKLGAHLVEEQQSVLKEMQALIKNLRHMKHIIASHQTMAKAVEQREQIALVDALSHAIEMSFQPGDEKWLAIRHEYQEVPTVLVDPHQFLQILVNLLRNAKQAMQQQPQDYHELFLSVGYRGNDKASVVMTIQDSGVGIAPEHLSKMFTRGFTTKKDGNGIGLHSAVAAIHNMGGAMHVQSEGVGKGTIFTLILPVLEDAVVTSQESTRALSNDVGS